MTTYDLVIVGAGPAGLALAQYAATRGYTVQVLEASNRSGGRAATSPWLENVPGFPNGITGREFGKLLRRQATRLGASVTFDSRVVGIERAPEHLVLTLENGDTVHADHVVLANGLVPRKGQIENASQFAGSLLSYEPAESFEEFAGKRVGVYGGGNAAGQVILALARQPGCHVEVLLWEPTVIESIAPYLARRIIDAPNVHVRGRTRVYRVRRSHGFEVNALEAGMRKNLKEMDHLFVFLGGEPQNEWLKGVTELTDTGHIAITPRYGTDIPGVYAIGDTTSSRGNTVMAAYGDAARVLGVIENS